MKSIKNKAFKLLGVVSLLISAIVITPASLIFGHQPKCPEELLK